MCYWVGSYKVKEALERHYNRNKNVFLDESIERKLGFNFMERRITVARSNADLTILKKEGSECTFDNYKWNLRWSWENDGVKNEGNPLPNIRDKKAVWRHRSLLGTNNCILPIRGYIEFHHLNKEKYPFFIYPREEELLFAAGLYNDYVDEKTGEINKTFGLLTTDPNERVAKIHNNPDRDGARMLVLVPSEQVNDYLDPVKGRNILKYCCSYPADKLADYPIRHFLRKENAHLLDDDVILKPVNYPELAVV
jgi:putative SOS response-associated peptidase YedK